MPGDLRQERDPRGENDLRRERGRTTRERLIAAGRELFGELGYEATSVEAVLQRAGVARGGLYHHFDSKKSLFDAVLDRVVAEVSDQVSAAARGLDPVAGLRAGCAAWLTAAMDPAVQRIVLLDPPSVVGWNRWRELDELHTLGRLRRSLELIAASGRIPGDHVDLLAHMVLASVSEASSHIARAADKSAALKAGLATVDLLIDRLVTPPVR
jgi:AcrR family transcriptional regulator